ncbi:transmembrane and coiled-coil domains protein 2-like isoform X2 [Ornithodoros turicata]|uniref:transmembrane and coiled-coil domains protein 2-like isoform X2 n=1 Tax=Ornithodoros turicata TaxID=34597 RepID=UPI003139E2A9
MKRKKSPHLSQRAPDGSALSLPSLQGTPRPHNSSAGSLDGDDGELDGTPADHMSAVSPGGGLSSTFLLANGSDFGDETDHLLSHTPDPQRTRTAIEHINQKIARTRGLIKAEQTARDENVNEYLKLATNADKQQMQRIKNIFEKKNQKSAQTIAQQQKKLETYIKRKRDLETHGASSSWQPREVLQNVGQGISGVVGNIKGGLSGLASVTHSSTDNKYPSDDDSSSMTSESSQMAQCTSTANITSPRHPPLPSVAAFMPSAPAEGSSTVISVPTHTVCDTDLESVLIELNERKEECQRLSEEVEALKNQMQQEYTYFSHTLQEERYRYERLEEQMNDLIELHQNEIENLKQGIADMEEKVQYQSEERLRDVQEVLESCQTRISRMEHQQHQHLQQLVSLDSLDNSRARALCLKLVNVLLMLLQLILLLISTVANIIMPFLQSRLRVFTTALLILAICTAVKQWPELSVWFKIHLSDLLERLQR